MKTGRGRWKVIIGGTESTSDPSTEHEPPLERVCRPLAHGLANALSRSAIACAVWLAAALGLEGCSDPSGPALAPPFTATVVAATNSQAGLVGTGLPLPLKVKVDSAGIPKAGVTVKWHATAGSVAPTESVTDRDGVASAAWTLGTVAGRVDADATIRGAQRSLSISTPGRAGPGGRHPNVQRQRPDRSCEPGAGFLWSPWSKTTTATRSKDKP